MQNNTRVRNACIEYDVRLWEVAEKLNMSESKLSKMLRKELSELDTLVLINTIKGIREEKELY